MKIIIFIYLFQFISLLSNLRFEFTKRFWGIRIPFMKYFKSDDELVVITNILDLVPVFQGLSVWAKR